MASVRLIRHEIVPKCGSFEVRQYGRPSLYFYWGDDPGSRLDSRALTSEQALELARAAVRRARSVISMPAMRYGRRRMVEIGLKAKK